MKFDLHCFIYGLTLFNDSYNFCLLLIMYAKSLDTDQGRQDQNIFKLCIPEK